MIWGAGQMGSSYRRGVYSISSALSGAIVQVCTQKDSFLKDMPKPPSNLEAPYAVFNPRCIVLAGKSSEELTNEDKLRSFELFRQSLHDVQVITYDELFRKIESLLELLE